MDVAGRTAIVTGGASGLGAATARQLAAAGASVAIFDRAEEEGRALAGSIGAMFQCVDVADSRSAEHAVSSVVAEIGPPAVLVNCAGIGGAARIVGRDGPMPLDAFEKVVRVNLVGSFNMMRLVANAMSSADADSDGQRGVIVSTASVAAYEGQIGQARLCRLQGRHHRADPAGGARTGPLRHKGPDHRARPVPDRRCSRSFQPKRRMRSAPRSPIRAVSVAPRSLPTWCWR